ncbi:hypothetical protein J2R98_000226 [Alkalibacillus filiformis]|uniref:Phage protein n=1 Tax=Alkalibacillus filiformis TaxID=200990 RepID=A0ABU0DPP1_9BACI|nr:hypothetical protein [Alkalibacillus filiformis]
MEPIELTMGIVSLGVIAYLIGSCYIDNVKN